MENKPLTAREFVLAAAQAYRCPACGAPEVTWSGVDVVGGSAYQAGRCGVCGKVFTAIFRLVGYLRGDDVQTIAEDPGEIGPVEPAAFGGIDYELLDKQVSALYGVMGDLPGKDPNRKLLEGLAELVTQIHEKRPFPAGKE